MAIVHSRHDMICWQSLRPATVASRLTRNVANSLPACYSVAHKYIICYSFVFLPLNLSRKGTRGRGRHARTHAPCVADRSGRNASFQLLSDYGRSRARWENIRGKKRVREEERNERRKRKTKKKKGKDGNASRTMYRRFSTYYHNLRRFLRGLTRWRESHLEQINK